MASIRLVDRSLLLRCVVLAAGILAVHTVPFFRFSPGDADRFLIPWYLHILDAGRINVFSHAFSNYTPPYLYLLSAASLLDGLLEPIAVIKLLSGVGAIWMAFAITRLLAALGVKHAIEWGLTSLLLPTVVLNASALAQADTFWVAPCVLALIAALESRQIAVGVWSGVAFAFKAQAAFFAPFVLLFFITRKAPWWCWLIPPTVYAIAVLPAWLMGWDGWHLLTVYLRQAQWQPGGRVFISNGASWWTIYGYFFPDLALKTFWIGYVTTAAAVVLYLGLLSRRVLSPTMMLGVASLSAAGVPFLLPGMHERFFILADVLTFCLAVADPKPKTVAVAVLMQLGSAIPGWGWAMRYVRLRLPGFFFGFGALLLLIEYLFEALAKRRLSRPERVGPAHDAG